MRNCKRCINEVKYKKNYDILQRQNEQQYHFLLCIFTFFKDVVVNLHLLCFLCLYQKQV